MSSLLSYFPDTSVAIFFRLVAILIVALVLNRLLRLITLSHLSMRKMVAQNLVMQSLVMMVFPRLRRVNEQKHGRERGR